MTRCFESGWKYQVKFENKLVYRQLIIKLCGIAVHVSLKYEAWATNGESKYYMLGKRQVEDVVHTVCAFRNVLCNLLDPVLTL